MNEKEVKPCPNVQTLARTPKLSVRRMRSPCGISGDQIADTTTKITTEHFSAFSMWLCVFYPTSYGIPVTGDIPHFNICQGKISPRLHMCARMRTNYTTNTVKGIISTLGVVLLTLSLGACSTIPSNTPLLLDLTAERIETRSEVITKTLRSVLDEANFARRDIEDTRTSLQSIDTSKLNENDKKTVTSSIERLKRLESSLGKTIEYSSVPDDSNRIFRESANSIRIVRQIIATEVDRKSLVQDIINTFEKTKGDRK